MVLLKLKIPPFSCFRLRRMRGFRKAWLITSKAFANKIKSCSSQIQEDCGANRECPRCHYVISNSDVTTKWPGFPKGVKFDPSDADLTDHLAAKVGIGNSEPHTFIDAFIPTIKCDNGICYTHPENLPGARKDGTSFHLFHKTLNAYSTGQRKRRRIDKEQGLDSQAVRWHKTGKTKAIKGGVHLGWKKIMVLYKSSNKGTKADKASWVMHQYHLGNTEEEKEGEYVVSKIFYQHPKQSEKTDKAELESYILQNSPVTTTALTPTTPAPHDAYCRDADPDEYMHKSPAKVDEYVPEASQYAQVMKFENNRPYHDPHQADSQYEDIARQPTWLAGESQTDEYDGLNRVDDTFLWTEKFNSSSSVKGEVLNPTSDVACANNTNGVTGNRSTPFGIPDLEDLEFDSLPEFQLHDLPFYSQDATLDSWDFRE